MDDYALRGFFANEGDPYAVILGVNEIASAVAVRLCWEGCRVVMSHDQFPPVIRRKMSFHDALFYDRVEVDGIVGQRADNTLEIVAALVRPGRVDVRFDERNVVWRASAREFEILPGYLDH